MAQSADTPARPSLLDPMMGIALFAGIGLMAATGSGLLGLIPATAVLSAAAVSLLVRSHRLAARPPLRGGQRRHLHRFAEVQRRLGDGDSTAITALVDLADEWPAGRQRCVDVLCAYIRRSTVDGSSERLLQYEALGLIAQRLRAHGASAWHGCDLNLAGAAITGTTFNSARFTGGTVDLRGATFVQGHAGFANASFEGGLVDFTGATFSDGVIDFTGATFSGGLVHFTDVTFSGVTVDFSLTRLTAGIIDFTRSNLANGKIIFYGMRCLGGGLDFTGARLTGAYLLFVGALIGGGRIDFRAAELVEGSVEFTGSHLADGTVDFTLAVFLGGTVDLSQIARNTAPALFAERAGRPPVGVLLPGDPPDRHDLDRLALSGTRS